MGRSLKNIVAGLTPRERRLLAVMGLMFFVFVIFIVVFVFSSSISDMETESEQLTATLKLLDLKEADYKAQKQTRPASTRSTQKPTPLRTLVEKVSRKLEVDTPDMKELPDQKHGTQWLEHAMELTMQEIDILKLTEFMEEIESNRRSFPIAISKLVINKRKRPTGSSYTVKLTVSTYEERKEATSKDKSGSARKKRKSTPSRKGVI
jgi:type II secretory pathway component PulM